MELAKVKQICEKIQEKIENVMVGKKEMTELVLAAILADGNILIEDNPGTGKTTFVKALASSIGGECKRIQFTPDLMPTDITGLNVFNQKEGEFNLVKGPIFTNILLADEINRATPRTQSSLLEAMEERQVSIDGTTLKLDNPFFVLATENPIEQAGTYPLPEALLDRFIIKLRMGTNDRETELNIINRSLSDNGFNTSFESVCKKDEICKMRDAIRKVHVGDAVKNYIVDIVYRTRQDKRLIAGVSSRGTLAMIRMCQAYAGMNNRAFVEPDDVRKLAKNVFSHRIVASGVNKVSFNETIIDEILASVEVPVEDWEK